MLTQGRAKQGRGGRAGQGRGPRPPGGTPQTPLKSTDDANGRGVWGPSLLPNGKEVIRGRCHYSPRIPGGFTLPHRLVETLGRGLGRSLERPCKWSAALSAV